MLKLKTEKHYPDVAKAVEQTNDQRLRARRNGEAAFKELLAYKLVQGFSTGIVERKAGQGLDLLALSPLGVPGVRGALFYVRATLSPSKP